MRAAVADYRPDITNHHIRSHPEAVGQCIDPFSTQPSPARCDITALGLRCLASFNNKDGNCANRFCALHAYHGVRRLLGRSCRSRP